MICNISRKKFGIECPIYMYIYIYKFVYICIIVYIYIKNHIMNTRISYSNICTLHNNNALVLSWIFIFNIQEICSPNILHLFCFCHFFFCIKRMYFIMMVVRDKTRRWLKLYVIYASIFSHIYMYIYISTKIHYEKLNS